MSAVRFTSMCNSIHGYFPCIFDKALVELPDYSVGQFYENARQITEETLSKGRVPIVSGGTGLYLRWYVQCYYILVSIFFFVTSDSIQQG